jgi:hypothetical protein
MRKAWMQTQYLFLFFSLSAVAQDAHEAKDLESPPNLSQGEQRYVSKEPQPTVAMREPSGKPIRANELFNGSSKPEVFVTKNNMRVELAPYSVIEINSDGELKIMRGSALVETRNQQSLKTSSAVVDVLGRSIVSYDHKERSTSAFVLDGEARMVNPSGKDKSLRLERFHGASLEIHAVMPQLIRQLEIESLDSWLSGYSWPKKERAKMLSGVPDLINVSEVKVKDHLAEVRLEDYFSSIETADEFHQPEYYQNKFADPDKVVAEANATKSDATKPLSPEEAALIALPNTKIDIDMEMLGSAERQKEMVKKIENPSEQGRKIASVDTPKMKAAKPVSKGNGLDPEVNAVLERLRGVKAKSPVISKIPAPNNGRAPASISSDAVPDPVYDYSQNF